MMEQSSTSQTNFEKESYTKPKKKEGSNSGKSYWIFQSTKERFDISNPDELDKDSEGWWPANQKAEEMNPGDEVFFWLAGDEEYRGIYGTGVLTSSANSSKKIKGNGQTVDYKCLKRIDPNISIKEIRENDALQNLQILHQPQGTNFQIKASEADALFAMIESREEKYNDPYKLHLDTDTDVDNLGRKGFVDALAIWINRIWEKSNQNEEKDAGEKNSFMMHLHGTWGSGKSTILNLLEKRLTENPVDKDEESDPNDKDEESNLDDIEEEWIVINFNAWQNCHIQPGWWPILMQLYKGSRKQLKLKGNRWKAFKLWCYDFWWKLLSGNKGAGIVFIVFTLLLFSPSLSFLKEYTFINNSIEFIYGLFSTVLPLKLISVELISENWDKIISAGSVISGGVYFFKSLVWGSAEAAEGYLKFHEDPLERIKEYFKKVVKLADKPIMIYIDDLDRCEPEYVVELLENIQTLFNNSRVFYLVAADRRWIYSSFQKKYGDFKKEIEEPGKHIGYLFLDKIFQLSISVPRINLETQKAYLNYLYKEKDSETDSKVIKKAEDDAKAKFKKASVNEIIDTVNNLSDGDFPTNQAWKEAAVRASASKEAEAETEIFLLQFSHLLEPNPRSIKRLVNNYGVFRAIAILSDTQLVNSDENRKKFALWNILKMRWPLFVEYLEENPGQIDDIINALNNADNSETHNDIADLINRSNALKSVIKNTGVGVSLDVNYIKRVLKLEKTE